MPTKITDWAKINTKEKFNWAEAIIGALIIPAILTCVLILQLTLRAT